MGIFVFATDQKGIKMMGFDAGEGGDKVMALAIIREEEALEEIKKKGGYILFEKEEKGKKKALVIVDNLDGLEGAVPIGRDPFAVMEAVSEFFPCRWRVKGDHEVEVAVPFGKEGVLIGKKGKVAREIAKWGRISKFSVKNGVPCTVDGGGKVWLTRRGKPFMGPLRPEMVSPFEDQKGRLYLPPWEINDEAFLAPASEEGREDRREKQLVY